MIHSPGTLASLVNDVTITAQLSTHGISDVADTLAGVRAVFAGDANFDYLYVSAILLFRQSTSSSRAPQLASVTNLPAPPLGLYRGESRPLGAGGSACRQPRSVVRRPTAGTPRRTTRVDYSGRRRHSGSLLPAPNWRCHEFLDAPTASTLRSSCRACSADDNYVHCSQGCCSTIDSDRHSVLAGTVSSIARQRGDGALR